MPVFHLNRTCVFFDMKRTLPVCLRKALLAHPALGAAFVFSAPAEAASDKEVAENVTESSSATYYDVTVSPRCFVGGW